VYAPNLERPLITDAGFGITFKVLYSFCSFQGGSRGYSVDWEITFFALYEPIFVSRAYKNRDEVRLSPSAKGCSEQCPT